MRVNTDMIMVLATPSPPSSTPASAHRPRGRLENLELRVGAVEFLVFERDQAGVLLLYLGLERGLVVTVLQFYQQDRGGAVLVKERLRAERAA